MDDKGLKRAGLIVNPRSGKSSGQGMRLVEMLKHTAKVSTRVLDRFEQLPNHLIELSSEGVTDLFISSGDGTIQAIQTELGERSPFAQLPRLSLMPHGTTNMTAADLGFRHRSITAQAEYIRNLEPSHTRDRHTLRVVNPLDGKPRHGMFLGTGAISEASLYCQRVLNARGLKGSWATFATLARATGRTMFSNPNPNDETRFDRPYPLQVTVEGKGICSGTQLLLLSTTLEKLILNAKPFWGSATGPIRTTVLPYPVPYIPRWLLPMMYASETRKTPKGAISISTKNLEITCPISYVIDGEFFEGPNDTPLRVETGPLFTYLCG